MLPISVLSSPVAIFTATTATAPYTLSLHDALPILLSRALTTTFRMTCLISCPLARATGRPAGRKTIFFPRSEEHTSELQSHLNLVCRLLLEKKNPSRASSDGRSRHKIESCD